MIAQIRCEWRALLAALGVSLLLLTCLEVRFPYYFLQDDGLEYFLPSYIQNWRSFAAGHFPLYNFHTFGGIPHFSMGQPASLYVPQYLALVLSRIMFGNFFAAIDILAAFHVCVAIIGTYLLLRRWEVEPSAAVFGGMTSLSAFCLIVGRMWPPAIMLCAWFPWMLLAAQRFVDQPSIERAGLLLAVRMALFYGGYPQFFILAMIFELQFILIRVCFAKDGRGRALWLYLATLIPALLLACPLLLPMAAEVGRSQNRAASLPYDQFIKVFLQPAAWFYGQVLAGLPLGPNQDGWSGALLYVSHIGYVTSILSIGGAAILLKKRHRMHPVVLPCVICSVIALLWAWNVLGPGIYHIPLFNRFRWPFKLVFFSGFFQCMLASVVLNGCRRRWLYGSMAAFICGWIWVFCILPNHAWRVRDHHPPLPAVWTSLLEDGRYVVLSKDLVDDNAEAFVGFNYSEMWGLDNLLGYEPLVAARGAPGGFGKVFLDEHSGAFSGAFNSEVLARFDTWSVKHILVSPDSEAASRVLQTAGWQSVAVKGGWRLWTNPKSLPRVRWKDQASNVDEGLAWSAGANSIDITLQNWPGTQLTLAYTANPGLVSCIDTMCSEIRHSSDGLVHVEVPRGARHVKLVYRNHLFVEGVWLALATGLTLVLMALRLGCKGPVPAKALNRKGARPRRHNLCKLQRILVFYHPTGRTRSIYQ